MGKLFITLILVISMLSNSILFTGNIRAYGAEVDIKPYQDVRGKDLSSYNFRDKLDLLNTLEFNTQTKWPDKNNMPENFDPIKVIEHGKNPGLNVRKLQSQGYTGKGVGVAYVDQPLLTTHEAYSNVDLHYEIVADAGESAFPSMHGPAVLSLLAGREIGIVPDATVYFIGTGSCPGDQKNEAAGFRRIIEINKTLPEDKKIKIIGMSHRVANKPGYILKNSEELAKAEMDAEAAGIMVIDCDTLEDPVLLAITPDKDVDDYRNYTIATMYTSDNPKGKLCVPTSRTYAAGYQNDNRQYEFTQNGGQSWSVPYIVGVIAMGLQVNPKLTKEDAKKYLYDSGYDYKGGKIINPEGFVNMVRQNAKNPQSPGAGQDYRYILYNRNRVSDDDLKSINEYANKFMDGSTTILMDVSKYASAADIYDALKEDSKKRTGILKGIQIFGASNDVPAFDIVYKIQMQNGIDEGGTFKSDFFYTNFKSDSKSLRNDFSIYKAFNNRLDVSFISEWTVSRLPLGMGEIGPYMKRYYEYVQLTGNNNSLNLVNFSNPIFASSYHSDDFGYFLKEKMDKEFSILNSSQYRLYGNKQGFYPIKSELAGDFTKENISKENSGGVKEFIINTHGQWNNIDQAIFTTGDANSEKRISFMNMSNINSILSNNYYLLDLWTCLNGYDLNNNNLVHEAMANGKCISAMAASAIISNNGVHNDVSLEKMKKNNFYYFYYEYFRNITSVKTRSDSFSLAQRAYGQEILKNTDMMGDGNYQYNIHNVLSYHYFGLIEYNNSKTPEKSETSTEVKVENIGSNSGEADNTNIQPGMEVNIKFTPDYSAGGFKVTSYNAKRIGDNIEFALNYESSRDCDYSFFNPPNGTELMKIITGGIRKGTGTTKFTIGLKELKDILSVDNMSMRFGFDDKPNWISLGTSQLQPLINTPSSEIKTAPLPKVKVITQPTNSCKKGNTVSATVQSPGYTGKVQYRVFLYNVKTKKKYELYSSKSAYYGSELPGNSANKISFPTKNIPAGSYYMTVLVKQYASKASYDSTVNTNIFVIR